MDDETQDVDIIISTDTRAGGSMQFNAKDYNITTLRVLGYKMTDGMLAFNELITTFSDNTDPLDPTNILRGAEITVKTGHFNFVFIANEGSDPALKTALADNSQINSLPKLRLKSFAGTAFSANKDIPMIAFYDNVKVINNYTLTNNGTPVSGTWKIGIDRLAVRVDIELTLTASQFAKWSIVSRYLLGITNIPTKAYLYPGNDNSTGSITNNYEALFNNSTYAIYPGNIVKEPSGEYTVTYPRIILPESWFADATDATQAVHLQISLNDGQTTRTYKGKIGKNIDPTDPPLNYTLPRNTYVGVKASVSDDERVDIQAIAKDWDEASLRGVEFY